MTANVYDTGLPTSQRSAIRTAVMAKLAPLLKSSNPSLYLRAIVPLAMPISAGHDEQALALMNVALAGQAPAVCVALGKKTFEAAGSLEVDGRGILEVHVYVVSSNPRNTVDGRLANDVVAATDNTADPGIETMLEHVGQLLDGQDLGIDTVYEMIAESEDIVWTADDYTIFEQLYRVKVDLAINVDRNITQLVTSIAAQTSIDTAQSGVPVPAPVGSPANPFLDYDPSAIPLEAP